MKLFLIFFTVLSVCNLSASAATDYSGSSFQNVRDVMFENPYSTLPHNQITFGSFGGLIWDNHLRDAVHRTLNERVDYYPHFDKLLHANGICFSGTWEINQDTTTNYSGYFAAGSKALMIARASVTLSDTTRGNKRGFALAGKVFPTLDPMQVIATGNFFTIENLLGIDKDFYTDAILTNEPDAGITFSPTLIMIGARILKEFGLADTHPGYRDLYPISELGLSSNETARTPHWIKITASPETNKKIADDFRDELTLSPGEALVFDIEVANGEFGNSITNASWKKIGQMVFTESVVSEGCDHRIHFAHPKNSR